VEDEKLEVIAHAFVEACAKKDVRFLGTVRWFGTGGKSFGFISPEDGSHDVFVHFTAIIDQSYPRTLHEGQLVEFEIVDGPKGKSAARVKVIEG
jgi:CspA family cold shock protein